MLVFIFEGRHEPGGCKSRDSRVGEGCWFWRGVTRGDELMMVGDVSEVWQPKLWRRIGNKRDSCVLTSASTAHAEELKSRMSRKLQMFQTKDKQFFRARLNHLGVLSSGVFIREWLITFALKVRESRIFIKKGHVMSEVPTTFTALRVFLIKDN